MARKLLTLFAVSLLLFPMWLELKAGEPFTLVIDAGHGGKDPGAKGKIINEKEINLKIALKLGVSPVQSSRCQSRLYPLDG